MNSRRRRIARRNRKVRALVREFRDRCVVNLRARSRTRVIPNELSTRAHFEEAIYDTFREGIRHGALPSFMNLGTLRATVLGSVKNIRIQGSVVV